MEPLTAILIAVIGLFGSAVGAVGGVVFVRRQQTTTVNVNELIEKISTLEAELMRVKEELAATRTDLIMLQSKEERHLERLIDAERRIFLMEQWIRAQGADPHLIAPSQIERHIGEDHA